MRLRWPLIFLLALTAALLAQAARHYPKMPEHMASHFDASGAADGWMSKRAFFEFLAGLTAFLLLMFVGLAKFLPKVPDAWINLPRKSYWLAGERREGTLRFVSDWLLWQGCWMLAFTAVVHEWVYQANSSGSYHLDGRIWVAIAAFVIWTLSWIGLLLAKFLRVPGTRSA